MLKESLFDTIRQRHIAGPALFAVFMTMEVVAEAFRNLLFGDRVYSNTEQNCKLKD